MPTDTINGVTLHWRRAGDGPRVLFCNGSGSTLADISPVLALLATRCDVLAWDHRGIGESGPVAGTYTMADLAADAIGLLDLVGWDRCAVFGISFGGMVAQELAVTAPGRVSRLVLACTSAGGAGGASYPLHTLAELDGEERLATMIGLMDTRWSEGWLAEHPGDRFLADGLAARGARGDTPGARAQLRAREGHDTWERLAQLTCPTLITYGEHDALAPPVNSERLAAQIPGAELRGYDGGHMFFAQDPAALPYILRFLTADAG